MRQLDRETKEIQGTYEPSKEFDSMEFEVWDGKKMPACPKGLPFRLQSIWNERCKELLKAGYLSSRFLPGLQEYVFALYQSWEAQEKLVAEGFVIERINTKGSVMEVINPQLTVLESARKTLNKYEEKFGLTPVDIQKIPAIKKEETKLSLLK